jgi:outer membrane protein OmpA-like peptidoglycan-associated protein
VITATTLTGSSVGGATLTGANKLANLGPFSDTGAGNATGFSLNNAQSLLTIDTVLSTGPVRLTTTAGSLTIDADVTAAADTVTLKSPGGIDQLGGVIDAASLLVGAAAAVSLPDANKVGTLAAQLTGPGAGLTFNDTATGLTIGTVGGVSGVTTDNGAIVLQTSMSGAIALDRPVDAGTAGVTVAASGNLAIGAGGSVSAGAGATLATLGNFSNAAGAGAITVGAGSRWLVYSSNPNADTDGGLTPSFIQYAATYTIATLTGTAPAAAAGNGFLYSLTPAALTLTGVTKTYDGTTGLIGASYSASGAVAGDTLTFGGAPAGSFAGKNAGSGIDVTVSGLTVTAKRGGITVYGYTVGAVANDPIGAIAKAVLTASLTGTVVKTYDGTTAATLDAGNYALTGIVTGDAVSLNDPAAGSYADKNAASGIAVTVGGLGLVGAEAGNYTLAKTSLTANIGTIDPKTVSAGLTGTVTKNADGTNIATLTPGNYTLSGVVSGDGVSLNDPAHGTYASAQLGSGIAVTVTGLALTGSAARDYVLAGTTATANIGTIRPGLPKTPFIPVQPPQPPASASNSVNAHSLVVPKPELAELVKLSGCTGGDFVAVVPGEDGHVGTVVIEADGNKTILHAAYAGCSGSRPVITTPQEVNAIFGIALTARPAPPLSFELYYRSGSTTLEAQAQAVFGQAVAAIGQRKPVDVVVTGYTDTAGTPHANDILSLARAQAVTKLLLARGLPPGAVATYGRGARELLVPTPDHVAEDKNRRVEITVR